MNNSQVRGNDFSRLLWVAVIFILAACTTVPPATSSTPVPAPRTPSEARTQPTPLPTWTPTLPPTAFPTVTPRATRTSPATLTPTAASPCPRVAQKGFFPAEELHDVIFFTSRASAPFLPPHTLQSLEGQRLWAVAVDGSQAGSLNQRGGGVYFSYTAEGLPQVILLTMQPVPQGRVPGVVLRQQQLPAACRPPTSDEETRPFLPCDGFTFSADGTWAAFYFGSRRCGRGIGIINTATGASSVVVEQGGRWLEMTGGAEDARLLYAAGPCTTPPRGRVHELTLASGSSVELGPEPPDEQYLWNAQRSAFVVSVPPREGWQGHLWGYHLASGSRFLDLDVATFPQPVWTPGGTHLLYQYRSRALTTPETVTGTLLIFGPQTIHRVTAADGTDELLLSAEEYDYHLCTVVDTCLWVEEWVQVDRLPFYFGNTAFSSEMSEIISTSPITESEGLSAESETPSQGSHQALERCLLHGRSCLDQPDTLGLHWETGETLSWSLVQTSTQTPAAGLTPAVPTANASPGEASEDTAPDLTRAPLYQAPDGSYALYLGEQQQSLWCVPRQGDPQPWVGYGRNFLYIP